MEFEKGIELVVGSTSAPYLSWSDGSVAEGVPTPSAKWLLVSFRTPQPPVLIGFSGGEASLMVEGQPGAWKIRSQEPFSGTVRFILPFGDAPLAASSAATLGGLVDRVKKLDSVWSAPVPGRPEVRVEVVDRALVAAWHFDQPGALVPSAVLLSTYGPYAAKLLSESSLLGAGVNGPVAVCTGTEMQVRFPVATLPAGRVLALGAPGSGPLGLMHAGSDLKLARFDTDLGSDFVAAVLARAEAAMSAAFPESPPDPESWLANGDAPRIAGAYSAVGGALAPDPLGRLRGAMYEAGLSAQRGLDSWRRLRGGPSQLPMREEALEPLRRALYPGSVAPQADPFVDLLFSPWRSLEPRPITIEPKEGKLMLGWWSYDGKPGSLRLLMPDGVTTGSLSNLSSASWDGSTLQFAPKDAGFCSVELVLPPGCPLPPVWTNPSYEPVAR